MSNSPDHPGDQPKYLQKKAKLSNSGSLGCLASLAANPNLGKSVSASDLVANLSAKEQQKVEKDNSLKIDLFIKQEKEKFLLKRAEPKLLILGSSDSGKSTLLKQLKILHGNGFSDSEKEWIHECIVWQIMEGLGVLIGLLKENNAPDDLLTKYGPILSFYNEHLSKPLPSSPKMVSRYHRSPTSSSSLSLTSLNSLNLDVKQKRLITLMSKELVDLAIAATTEGLLLDILGKSYNIHQLPDSTEYFFKKSGVVLSDGYVPSNEDILMQRSITMSISDTVFPYQGKSIHFIDVSGLKGHRKKWLPYFDDVNSILYVVSLSSFDQKMVEDGSVNRMADALVLFEQVVAHPLLAKIDVILFLNKKDLFAKKAQSVNLKTFFPEYSGKEYSVHGYAEFFRNKFLSLSRTSRNIAVHSTCCTDTKAMQVIISSMLISITTRSLRETGMIM